MSAGRQLLPAPPPKPAWMRHAPCNDADIDLFYPDKGEAGREARSMCNGGGPADRPVCLFRTQCLDYALTSRESYGLWGGFSEPDRRRMLQTGVVPAFPPPVPAHGSGHVRRAQPGTTVKERAAQVPADVAVRVRGQFASGVRAEDVAAWNSLPVDVVRCLVRGEPRRTQQRRAA